MPEELLKLAMNQGLWAAMFVALLFYVLRTNEKREQQLRCIIDKLADKLGILDNIEKSIEEIKIDLRR
ncbi:MAG: bacteriocin [Firmicutes bacterium]|nr:bacteriocin [Bacillota bacterium]